MTPIVVLVRPRPCRITPQRLCVAPVYMAGFGVIVALFWLIRWPTRAQSVAFVSLIPGSVCIGGVPCAQGDPALQVAGCGGARVRGARPLRGFLFIPAGT